MIERISIGYPQTLTQNTAYALPARRCLLFCDDAAPTFELATEPTFTSPVSITLSDGKAEVGGGFIMSTGGDVSVVVTPI